MDFLVGSRVEIVGFEAGMTNSYYAGTVVGYSRNARVRVEYETLTANGQARIDDFTRSDIRPYPADVNINIGVGDIVDVWENHGWWMGKCIAVNTRTDEYTVVKEIDKKSRKYERDDVRINQLWFPAGASRFWCYTNNLY